MSLVASVVPDASDAPDREGSIAVLKLYGAAKSINVRKVLWTCDELQRAVDHVHWDDPSADLKSAAFVAMNPNALAPIVDDDGFVLWESNAICRYLVGCAGRVDLLPRGAEGARDRRAVDGLAGHRAEQRVALRVPRAGPAESGARRSRAGRRERRRVEPSHDDPRRTARADRGVRGRRIVHARRRRARTRRPSMDDDADRPPVPLPHVEAWLVRLAMRPGYRRARRERIAVSEAASQPHRLPPPRARTIVVVGGVCMAAAMGIGRFAFTPLLPLMQQSPAAHARQRHVARDGQLPRLPDRRRRRPRAAAAAGRAARWPA